MTGSVSNQRL